MGEGLKRVAKQFGGLTVKTDRGTAVYDGEAQRVYSGRCNRCGHVTNALRAGEVACKWGGCNGTVTAS